MESQSRPDITAYLSEKILNRLRRENALVAEEVWVDPKHRVDFVAFKPYGRVDLSNWNFSPANLEHGTFTFVEVKSCMADFKSGHGLTFEGDRNILVCPRELERKLHESLSLPRAEVFCPNGAGALFCVTDNSGFVTVRTQSALVLLWAMVKQSAHLYRPGYSMGVE